MIAYIEGRVAEVTEHACIVVTTSSVGYEVHLPSHLLARLPEKGGVVSFYIYTVVREDALELYGFSAWDERQTFLVLLSISKVGAKTALAVLSLYRPDDLRRIVIEDDLLALTRVTGIGKKSAQHILLELKYKLKSEALPASAGLAPEAPASVLRDAVQGLGNLGYAEEEAAPVLKAVLQDDPDLNVAEALRAALKALAKAR